MRAQLARMPLLFGEEPAARIAQPRRRTIGASSNPAVIGHAEIRYLRGRVRFLTGGPYRASGFFSSVVVVWRGIMR